MEDKKSESAVMVGKERGTRLLRSCLAANVDGAPECPPFARSVLAKRTSNGFVFSEMRLWLAYLEERLFLRY